MSVIINWLQALDNFYSMYETVLQKIDPIPGTRLVCTTCYIRRVARDEPFVADTIQLLFRPISQLAGDDNGSDLVLKNIFERFTNILQRLSKPVRNSNNFVLENVWRKAKQLIYKSSTMISEWSKI